MFNQVILAGRVSKAPQQLKADTYKKCCFDIAVQKPFKNKESGQYETDFFHIICWSGLCERVLKYLKVGTFVIVKGRLEPNNYQNKDGINVYETQIIAENAIFMSGKEKIGEAVDEALTKEEE